MAESSKEPAGLLFTDIEGSTAHVRALGDDYGEALARHHELVRRAIADEAGTEIGSEGDSIAAVLPSAAAALRAAVAAQRAVADEPWPHTPWLVRMAVHAGRVEIGRAGAVGASLHEAARVRNVGHGGQILVSEAARLALGDAPPHGVRLADLGVHRIRDVPSPIRIHQAVAEGLATSFPALRTGSPAAIPRRLTSFVGRVAEVNDILRVLPDTRLLTVAGPGGAGKTRLAYEVAERAGRPTAVVELAGLDAAQVPGAAAASVGAPEPSAITVTVGDTPLLLVLDNCEHVLGPVAELVRSMLAGTTALTVLATSREPLAIAGERVWPVPPLASDDAVELFAQRAPTALAEAETGVVRDACEQLAGMPLAIELAAARLRSLTLEQLRARLDDQLAVLTGGARDNPRQQTLRRTLDWSYALLGRDEAVLLRRLAVFRGGFTLDAAERVVPAAGALDLLPALDGLVQKSLIELDRAASRYRMLEPVRQYAAEHLVEAGEEALAAAHAAWAASVASQASTGLFSDQAQWNGVLLAERGNLGAALTWTIEHDLPLAARLVGSLASYWFTAAQDEGAAWIPLVLAHVDELDDRSAARVYLASGIASCDDVLDPSPVRRLREAERRFRDLRHDRGLGSTLFWLGRALAVRGAGAEALAVFEESCAIHERVGDNFGLGWAMSWVGMLTADVHGDLAADEEIQHRVLQLAEDHGIAHIAGAALGELAAVAAFQGRREDSAAFLTRSIEQYRAIGDRWQLAVNLGLRALFGIPLDAVAATGDAVRALEIFEDLQADANLRTCLGIAAELLARRDRPSEAATVLGATRPELIARFRHRFESIASTEAVEAIVKLPEHTAAYERGATLPVRRASELARTWLAEAYPEIESPEL